MATQAQMKAMVASGATQAEMKSVVDNSGGYNGVDSSKSGDNSAANRAAAAKRTITQAEDAAKKAAAASKLRSDNEAAAKRLITQADAAAKKAKAASKLRSDNEAAAKRIITQADAAAKKAAAGTTTATSLIGGVTYPNTGPPGGGTGDLGNEDALADLVAAEDLINDGTGTATVVDTGPTAAEIAAAAKAAADAAAKAAADAAAKAAAAIAAAKANADADAAANASALSEIRSQFQAAQAAAAAAAQAAATAAAEDRAEAKRVAEEAAAAAEKLRIQLGNAASAAKLSARNADTAKGDDLADTSGLVSSFMPKVISESLKGEGNYDPNWVNANKVAGAQHIEDLTNSGQISGARSNITDANGNAIGGVANSQDNTAMQDLAAGGSTDPLGDLSNQVSDEAGLDTSLSGAWRQAIDGADGHNYEGGGGLLKFSQDGGASDQVDGFTEAERFGDSDEFAKIDTAATDTTVANTGDIDSAESTALNLSKFRDNLGFASNSEAEAFWSSMTPEAQAIFNSKENPSNADKILQGVFGLFIPGFGLLNKYMYNDDMTLQEKLDFSIKTANTVATNNLKAGTDAVAGTAAGGGGNEVVDTGDGTGVDDGSDGSEDATVTDSDSVEYSSLDSYLELFDNYKF